MKLFISLLLLPAAALVIRVNAAEGIVPATEMGHSHHHHHHHSTSTSTTTTDEFIIRTTECFDFPKDDGTWIQLPDFDSHDDNGEFVVAPLESPFQFIRDAPTSTDAMTTTTNESSSSSKIHQVRVQPAGTLLVSEKNDDNHNDDDGYYWTLGVFDTSPLRDERLSPGRSFDIFLDDKLLQQHHDDLPKHQAWYKNHKQTGRFAVTWNSTIIANGTNKHNVYQIVLSSSSGGTVDIMGKENNNNKNNICFCYGDMQWGPGKVRVKSSSSSGSSSEVVDYFGGTYGETDDTNNNIDSLDHKSCCFHVNKLKALLGSSSNNTTTTDFLSLCHATTPEAGTNGDPHFKTWKNEHFEYHGQCDLVLTKDPNFANGLGIDVHIRTKLVRHWSYIKNAVIRIGNDILEIQGSAVDFDPEIHYWINYEYQGDLVEFAGFPVEMFSRKGSTAVTKNRIEIDLGSIYPGQKIVLSTFKEFVKVAFENASQESFGKTVGMLGDFQTGKTFARDGVTILDDFTELGHEWQVLPSDKHLFREVSAPQFPAKCIDPEDPRGERRRRRLDGSFVSEEEANVACSGLDDELDRKDCVYDILATQDLDMAGAY